MSWPRSAVVNGPVAAAIAVALAVASVLLWSSPQTARANVACDVGAGAAGFVTGAIGLGNPAGDVCNAVTSGIASPVTGAVSGVLKDAASGVFGQLTTWVSEGAGWLMGQVVSAIDESTTPQLDTEGFLSTYARMAGIAAVMACAMLLLAILEGIAQGSPGLLLRVIFLNLPMAFLGTSVAFVVIQLLLGVTDELSAAVTNASHHGSTHFFEAAIHDLGHVGGEAGKHVAPEGTPGSLQGDVAGHVAVPLFVGFLAAIIGALAAFCVWIELAFRDAAVYVVSVFMPLSLAASIWPRWTGVLRKSCEILVALIGSKFVIVVIVALAAGLIAEDSTSTEHVLAAGVLMLLACFSPLVLFRLIPFSEGAMASAMERRSVPGNVGGAAGFASNVQMLNHMRGSDESKGQGVSLWGASGGESGGGGSPAGGAGGPTGKGPIPGGPGHGAEGGTSGVDAREAAGAGATGGAAAVPEVAARGAKAAGSKASNTAEQGSKAATGEDSSAEDQGGSQTGGGGVPRPASEGSGSGDPATGGSAPQDPGGSAPSDGGGGLSPAPRPSSADPDPGAGPKQQPAANPTSGAQSPPRPATEGSPGETGGDARPPEGPGGSTPSPGPGGTPPRPAPERPDPRADAGGKGGGS